MKKQVIPTRMELLKIRGRIKLASKGHSLLKRKRDVLIMELFSILKRAEDVRGELNKMLRETYLYLYYVLANHTEVEVESFAASTLLDYELNIEGRNVMGVKIPRISFNIKAMKKPKQYSPLVDYVAEQYMKILSFIVKVAEVETTVRRLLKEIETTKRRVNALEYVVLPSLEEQKKNITQKLEELERDAFVSLKSIKAKLSAKEESM